MANAQIMRMGLPIATMSNFPVFSNFTLNASTDKLEFIFQARDAITATRVGFRQGTVTGTSPVYKIGLQGVDTSGNPDGTYKGGGSPASMTFTPVGGGNNTWQWKTLDNSYVTTRGEWCALVIEYSSGTVDGSNNCSFAAEISSMALSHLPHSIQNDAGSRTRSANHPVFGYGSAGTAYGFPLQTISFASPTLNTTPDEYALKFSLPAGWGDTFKVVGMRFAYDVVAAKSIRIQLYTGTTVLQDVSLDSDYGSTNTTQDYFSTVFFDESSLSSLSFGSDYRIGIRPNEATAWTTPYLAQAAAADWEAWQGGQLFSYSTRTDDGAWTDDTTRRLFMELIIDDWTEPSGGASGGQIIGC